MQQPGTIFLKAARSCLLGCGTILLARSGGRAALEAHARRTGPPRTVQAAKRAVGEEGSGGAATQRSLEQPADQAQSRRRALDSSTLGTALLRRMAGAANAEAALDAWLAERPASSGPGEPECAELLEAALERGNAALALSVHEAMCAARPAAGLAAGGGAWPPATLDSVTALVAGLARALRLRDALAAIDGVRRRGVPPGDEVPFGTVVSSPLAPGAPLAVVQPHQGQQVVACAASRYEYEVFSGSVTDAASQALVAGQSVLLAAARAMGAWRTPAVTAVHELVVRSPSGQSRTFRFGTASADLPAQVGERVSVVCAPSRQPARRRGAGLLSAAPPFTRPGQPLAATNHALGREFALLLPPPPASAGLPGWLLPAAVLLAGSDAATALIDPALPLLLAGGAAAALASGVLGRTVVLPRLKQLPPAAVRLETTRQKLLAQHTLLAQRASELVDDASGDVRALARLWQLRNKMGAVGGNGTYEARLERVRSAIDGLEQRLRKKLELLDGYARLANMVEIEVEMDTEVPAAEVAGIEEQIAALEEVADLAAEAAIQAQAQDEVERLLRAT
ncbi:hypothetical protein WJX81_002704 [Elliptochloris bilobata]|uniref:Uncharacterized protein n=1 Tax=Elliptochloris bilobata TaxID=381761 RepID=A0AAW1RM94_9CHLO